MWDRGKTGEWKNHNGDKGREQKKKREKAVRSSLTLSPYSSLSSDAIAGSSRPDVVAA